MSDNKVRFKSILVRTDVTALKIIKNDYLFIGIGSTLHIYRLKDNELITKVDLFVGQKIHGIVPNDDQQMIIIYGGKCIRLISFIDAEISLNEFNIIINDWALSVIWIKNDSQIAILTAHNVVQIWQIDPIKLLNTSKCDVKCILYSGLLQELDCGVLVLAGTVFSQVVIWNTIDNSVLHNITGHKGVIFSITYSKEKQIIVTTSDDRSLRIWNIASDGNSENLTYWQNASISSRATLFGHTARVMRNIISDGCIVSVGEDGILCFWDHDGNLINKLNQQNGSSLWCIDLNVKNDSIVVGGSDSAVTVYPLSQNLKPIEDDLKILPFKIDGVTPKKIVITYRGNLVCLTEKGDLLYYDFDIENWLKTDSINEKYSNIAISKCKQFIVLFNTNGYVQILAETCKYDPRLVVCISQRLTETGIVSLHWLDDRKLILCDKGGVLSTWNAVGDKCFKIDEYSLPNCKERWLTAAYETSRPNYILIVGDRCGNIHVYDRGLTLPHQTIAKVHGRLGVNTIQISNDFIITSGRDGTLKYFKATKCNNKINLNFLNSIKFPFVWIERYLDFEKMICGFRESYLIIWSLVENTSLLEINCGGGHRSWDVHRKWMKSGEKFRKYLQLTFIKNSSVHYIDVPLDKTVKNIIKGTHTREINAIEICPHINKNVLKFNFLSGGEDNSIRLYSCNYENEKLSIEENIVVKKHLSNIKCLNIQRFKDLKTSDKYKNEYLMFSGGGRAQICTWKLYSDDLIKNSINLQEVDSYLLNGSDLDKKGNTGWKSIDINYEAETRIMSVVSIDGEELNSIIKTWSVENTLLIAGCSDGYLRLFSACEHNEKFKITLISNLKHSMKCILKVHFMTFRSRVIVISMSTDGFIAFWDVVELLIATNGEFQPFDCKRLHRAGINSFDIRLIGDGVYLFVTGGDDNDLRASVLTFRTETDSVRLDRVAEWRSDKYHCSQITGVKLMDDNFIMSASVDQRITLLKWTYDPNGALINCVFVDQYHSSVADVQGMIVITKDRNEILACVFGKGFEFFTVKLYGDD